MEMELNNFQLQRSAKTMNRFSYTVFECMIRDTLYMTRQALAKGEKAIGC